ncbi:unnamed protein product [Gadus morhua 'NCC']
MSGGVYDGWCLCLDGGIVGAPLINASTMGLMNIEPTRSIDLARSSREDSPTGRRRAEATQELGAGASCSERTALRRRSDESERPGNGSTAQTYARAEREAERERLEGGGRAVGGGCPPTPSPITGRSAAALSVERRVRSEGICHPHIRASDEQTTAFKSPGTPPPSLHPAPPSLHQPPPSLRSTQPPPSLHPATVSTQPPPSFHPAPPSLHLALSIPPASTSSTQPQPPPASTQPQPHQPPPQPPPSHCLHRPQPPPSHSLHPTTASTQPLPPPSPSLHPRHHGSPASTPTTAAASGRAPSHRVTVTVLLVHYLLPARILTPDQLATVQAMARREHIASRLHDCKAQRLTHALQFFNARSREFRALYA